MFKLIPAVLIALCAPAAFGAIGARTATVEQIQMESATRSGFESIVWIRQTGDSSWSGAPSCSVGWAYFNAKLNPHFMATVLSARMTDKPLRVYVDDALPRFGEICQIFNLEL